MQSLLFVIDQITKFLSAPVPYYPQCTIQDRNVHMF